MAPKGTQLNLTLLDCKDLKAPKTGPPKRNVQVHLQVEDLVATSNWQTGTLNPDFNEEFQVVLTSKAAPTLYVEIIHKDDPDDADGKETSLGLVKVNLALIQDRPPKDSVYTLEKKDFRQEVSGTVHLKVEFTHKLSLDPDEQAGFKKSAHVAKKKGGILEFYMNEIDKTKAHADNLEVRVEKAEPLVKELSVKVTRRDEIMQAMEGGEGAKINEKLSKLEDDRKQLQTLYKEMKAELETKEIALRKKDKHINQLEMMASRSKGMVRQLERSMSMAEKDLSAAQQAAADRDMLQKQLSDAMHALPSTNEEDDGAEDDDDDDEYESGLVDPDDEDESTPAEVKEMRKKLRMFENKFEKELDAKNEWKDKCLELQEMYNDMVQSKKDANEEANMQKKLEMVEQIRQECEEVKIALKLTESQLEEAMKKYRKEAKERKKLYNEIQELKGNIRVYCRCRPISQKELDRGTTDVTAFGELDDVTIFNTETGKKRTFEFDRTFDQETMQETVFEDTRPLMQSVLDGFNVCMFAYGQTGAGKTFTMQGVMGPGNMEGVNVRALNELFKLVSEKGSDYDFEMSIGVMEIYCGTIKDLLSNANDLKIKQEKRGNRTVNYVDGLQHDEVKKTEDVLSVIDRVNANRRVVATKMNDSSSRSHLIMKVDVLTIDRLSGKRTQACLNMIDLAGSERVARSGVEGQAMKEAQSINQSLSALGNVLAALGKGQSHVPYRNSALTHALADSLGGNSKVLMFANISPASDNVSETISTLEWATRARKVELGKAVANVSAGDAPAAAEEAEPMAAPAPAKKAAGGKKPAASPRASPAKAAGRGRGGARGARGGASGRARGRGRK